MGRFIVIYDEKTQQRQVILLDQLDYEKGFALELKNAIENARIGVYSLQIKSAAHDLPPFMRIDELSNLPEEDDFFYEDFVQIAPLSGQLFFQSAKQQSALTQWTHRLTGSQKANPKLLLAKIHQVGNVTQIPDWRSTLLAELLS